MSGSAGAADSCCLAPLSQASYQAEQGILEQTSDSVFELGKSNLNLNLIFSCAVDGRLGDEPYSAPLLKLKKEISGNQAGFIPVVMRELDEILSLDPGALSMKEIVRLNTCLWSLHLLLNKKEIPDQEKFPPDFREAFSGLFRKLVRFPFESSKVVYRLARSLVNDYILLDDARVLQFCREYLQESFGRNEKIRRSWYGLTLAALSLYACDVTLPVENKSRIARYGLELMEENLLKGKKAPNPSALFYGLCIVEHLHRRISNRGTTYASIPDFPYEKLEKCLITGLRLSDAVLCSLDSSNTYSLHELLICLTPPEILKHFSDKGVMQLFPPVLDTGPFEIYIHQEKDHTGPILTELASRAEKSGDPGQFFSAEEKKYFESLIFKGKISNYVFIATMLKAQADSPEFLYAIATCPKMETGLRQAALTLLNVFMPALDLAALEARQAIFHHLLKEGNGGITGFTGSFSAPSHSVADVAADIEKLLRFVPPAGIPDFSGEFVTPSQSRESLEFIRAHSGEGIVLDLGCWENEYLTEYMERHHCGAALLMDQLDYSSYWRKRARKAGKDLHFVKASYTRNLQYLCPWGTIDHVLLFNPPEDHLVINGDLISDIWNVMKPGGEFVVVSHMPPFAAYVEDLGRKIGFEIEYESDMGITILTLKKTTFKGLKPNSIDYGSDQFLLNLRELQYYSRRFKWPERIRSLCLAAA